jgi:cysteine desulfurase
VTRAYLDHASTAPLRPAALAAMLPYLREHHGDPGRVHTEGHASRVAVETARELVAARFGARPREVVFTSGGTESVNAAVWGALAALGSGAHAVTTAVEHSSVLDACRRSGAALTVVPVDRSGRYDPEAVVAAVRPDTALVSIQLANHEVGTVQPADAVAAALHPRDVLVHVDACAAAGHLPLSFRALDADLCSVTSHKLGGPKGVGALLVRRGVRVEPFVVGGAQERARRGGIENVPAIVGFGAACEELAGDALDHEAGAQRALIDATAAVVATVPGLERYGHPVDRLPNLLCFGVSGVEAEPVLLALDQHGVAAHSGSSCSSETLEPSPVLAAMGVDAEHSLRVSVGWSTTRDEVDRFVEVLPGIVERLRGLRTT